MTTPNSNAPRKRRRASEWLHRSTKTKAIEERIRNLGPKEALADIAYDFRVSRQWVHFIKNRMGGGVI